MRGPGEYRATGLLGPVAVFWIDNTQFRARAGIALATVVLHGLLLAPMLPGRHGHARGVLSAAARHQDGGAGGDAKAWVMLEDPRPLPGAGDDMLRSQWAEVQPRALGEEALASLSAQPDVDLGTAQADTPMEPDSPLSYIQRMGALTSRIQGVWALPRGTPAADFHCRLLIHQRDDGAVEDLEFEHCDDDAPLRKSLMNAIYRAAPLPRMNDAGGRGAITLDFVAFASPASGRRTIVSPGNTMP